MRKYSNNRVEIPRVRDSQLSKALEKDTKSISSYGSCGCRTTNDCHCAVNNLIRDSRSHKTYGPCVCDGNCNCNMKSELDAKCK
jgi:hypothetical protein